MLSEADFLVCGFFVVIDDKVLLHKVIKCDMILYWPLVVTTSNEERIYRITVVRTQNNARNFHICFLAFKPLSSIFLFIYS
jgi:hypothetical protein